jgi:NADPH:quinone reductase-like Zn-dependent oxidoreductase
MKAVRVREFGPPEVMQIEELERPVPGPGEVLVEVAAASVGPWDAWVRAGKSVLPQPLPLTPGSDLSGTVITVGSGVTNVVAGDSVYGATNPRFVGAYAEFAVCVAAMIALKPSSIGHVEAASIPVVAVTAWEALFERARLQTGDVVLILGAAGRRWSSRDERRLRASSHGGRGCTRDACRPSCTSEGKNRAQGAVNSPFVAPWRPP